MKKFFLFVFLLNMVSLKGLAHDFSALNSDGVTIYYNYTDGGVEVFYNSNNWNCYSGTVNIPSIVSYNGNNYNVVSIGDQAFSNCTGLTSVTIPEGVTSIGSSAFAGCTGLTSVTIPEGVTSIGNSAFFGCSGLTSVTIPEGVTSIGKEAFHNCSGLTSVTIPEGVTSIGESAFYGCSGLTSVTIPSSVTSIGNYAFDQTPFYHNLPNVVYIGNLLYSVKSDFYGELVIREGTIAISDNACGTRRVTSVTIPSSVTSIGSQAFYNCDILTSVTISEGVTSIGYSAFSSCTSLKSVTIPSSVTSIGNKAFYKCSRLTSVTINSDAVMSKDYSVSDDLATIFGTEVKEFIIGEGVTSIGGRSFMNFYGLTSVTIPSSVTSIGNYAFYNCELTSVYSYMETPPSIDYDTFSNRKNATLYVPCGCKAAYESKSYWREFKEIIEMDPTEMTLTIGSAGMGTFASAYDLNFTGIAGVKAYIASGFNPQTGKLVLTPVEEVPAGTGLLVKGKAGEYTIPVETTAMYYTNLLVGLTEDTEVAPTEGGNTNFILANGSHGVSFYTLSEAGTIAAGKAYLTLPTRSVENLANGITLVFDDDQTTGISLTPSPSLTGEESGYYTLDGIKLNGKPMKKGVYIRDGKKVVVK